MAGVTLEELIAHVGISTDELNKPCSDEHITSISLFLANWQTVAPLLGLTETDEEDVEEEGKRTQSVKIKSDLCKILVFTSTMSTNLTIA